MAKVAKKVKGKKVKSGKVKTKASGNNVVVDIDLATHGDECMFTYGRAVIEDRAFPDYRDGLLPVQRRILYAAFKMGMAPSGGTKKSARLVGDVIGKYHPHGDTAAYGSVVQMVNASEPYFIGQGNFGSMTDEAAAMRYTELKLSKYGYNVFFSADHLEVSDMVPNYDGKDQEPMILPSLLPNLLLNGSSGNIAVGTAGWVPAFGMKGVIELTKKALRKQPIDVKDCSKALKINYARHGSTPCTLNKGSNEQKEIRKEWRQLLSTGAGRAIVTSDYTIDAKNRTINITSIPPQTDVEKLIGRVAEDDRVKSCTDETSRKDPFLIQVVLKQDIGVRMVEAKALEVIEKHFSKRCSFRINAIEKSFDYETETPSAELLQTSVLDFFKKWTKWRIDLEVKALNYRKGKTQEQLALQELMLLACKNIDLIVKALKAKNTEEVLMKGLKITAEQVDTILSRQIRSLKALEAEKLVEKIKETKAFLTQLDKWIKKPADKIVADIDTMVASI